MGWPEVILKIFEDVAGAFVTIAVVLALLTDFWDNLFRGDK